MVRIEELVRVENLILTLIVIASPMIFTITLFYYETDLFSFTVAYAEPMLTIKHDVQTESQVDSCMYSISIVVLDSATKKAIPDALVEFETSSINVITNKTEQNGATQISFVLEKEPGKTCTEILLSQGYSIEAFSVGYTGHGIGTIS